MYITPNQYFATYRDLKRTSLSHSTCKLVIFVSCLDVDSLCAAKMFSLLLKKELIQYQLLPVVGYKDLKSHYDRLDDDVTNVVLIGCGAMLDVENFLDVNPEELLDNSAEQPEDDQDLNDVKKNQFRRKIYIIDGHRPWNLDNLFGSEIVVCLDDGYVDGTLLEEKKAYEGLILEDEEEESGSDSESDFSDDEELDEETDVDMPSESELVINSQDPEDTVTRKRKLQEKYSRQLRKQKKQKKSVNEDKLQSYYNQGSTISTANTITVYALLTAIGETNLESLWIAIIGTSSLDSHYPEIYDKLQPLLKEEVMRLNPEHENTKKKADQTILRVERDYHLFLLRHWTLYDSFFYSSHVNSKLNLWTDEGKKRLHKLFAKMGVSLAVAQQKWLYMDTKVKRQLPIIFRRYLPIYGLEGIVREGFIKTYGYTGSLSAMECVEALSALLELDEKFIQESAKLNEEDNKTLDNEDDKIRKRMERKESSWLSNFWSSWDALNVTKSLKTSANQTSPFTKLKGSELLFRGLEYAKQLQQITFRTGMSLLERKMIKNLKLYRLCVLNDGAVPDLEIFINPLMLSKLGTWLIENLAELDFINGNHSLKPLVVASLDVSSDTYLVIGLAPRYPRGMSNSEKAKLLQEQTNDKITAESMTTHLNTFSVAFQQLSNTSGAKVRVDSFDSSIIEIRKDDLAPFLEKLTLSGLI
ncbi:Cdc45 DNA replication initiation factor [Candida orthopsilosis Co 90-125]|uniref:Cdc45 DNA replication initiation factor n=1 Tax=Candida orthopsilosis (strain 90-125) TaxID=1136231 RepID=H8XAL3_CANO9|nr:Cdc45 DNA replication initiation factor [Candida orthopsilosis Co 90-125]CCG24863.1 Cdc45 DNA replication initiation factor [Candida orthopsilosis Co 90-125]